LPASSPSSPFSSASAPRRPTKKKIQNESDVSVPFSVPSNETWNESVTWSVGQVAEARGYESATFANIARASESVPESLLDYCLCLRGAESESENVACHGLDCAGEIARGVVLAHVGHVDQANDFEVGENDRIVGNPS
jgi:hypothetical protein